ncbi:P-loop containing nucleoside triphosphate hydrolase protein [Polyplosphaeria fusca]|uniref:P-loop containing nucleoside triphosphate hydrolase protein n=1 Tax=Polyplosphaeria fusca TaxID=682080 RepID=A0A9P4V147_9PLEO|nr:P-loop containing nucleoside triphosphate hydrolase protein [Polyplosphaeria fusca]
MSTDQYDRVYVQTATQPEAKKAIGTIATLEDLTEVENVYGDVQVTRPTAERWKDKKEADQDNGAAMTLRRRLLPNREVKSVKLEIRSSIIHEALETICGDSFWLSTRTSPIIINEPYFILFHYREDIREYATSSKRTEEEKRHMELLTTFMAGRFKRVEAEYVRLCSGKQITFSFTWALFRPGEEVLIHTDQYVECGIVQSLSIDKNRGWIIGTRSWDFNGSHFGPTEKITSIPSFEGQCDITSLSIYPFRFHSNEGGVGLRKELIERGRKWRSLLEVAHRNYHGLAWSNVETDPRSAPMPPTPDELVPVHISGRVILDYQTHFQENPSMGTYLSDHRTNRTEVKTKSDKDDKDENDEKDNKDAKDEKDEKDPSIDRFVIRPNDGTYELTDDQAILCPARVRGFALSDKRWAYFLVDRVTEIQWRMDAMQRLEVSPSAKATISALVEAHENYFAGTRPRLEDVIPGKGLGLVLLFAGAPGLGKTLTAEVVAEQNRKPLYSITSGELGVDPSGGDTRMRRIFDRAKAWNAYLLLDEADVFLAERDQNNLARNGMVAVFLRLIEYYEGVIFLTTNRIRAFDPAFESRIQLKLSYGALTAAKRANIWRNLLSDIKDNVSTSFFQGGEEGGKNDVMMRLGEKYLVNGREIKNMITTALALAMKEDVPLMERHLETIDNINKEWARAIQD